MAQAMCTPFFSDRLPNHRAAMEILKTGHQYYPIPVNLLMEQLTSDQAEYVRLLTLIQEQLRGLCCVLMPDSIAEVDDILQETNRVMLEKSAEFQLGTDFRAWAFSIVRFQVLAHQKRQSRNRMIFNADLVNSLVEKASNDLLADDRMRFLAKCLEELKMRDRELIWARYESEDTLREYSQRTGRSVSAIKKSLSRIRGQLSDCIRRRAIKEECVR
jgi:RNA polymerase sigma-70 factor, ECF subfamily